MIMDARIFVQNLHVETNGVTCPETLSLVNDVRDVWSSLFQVMPVIGPWFESRMSWLIRQWLPRWKVSSGQIYDPNRPELRSRSWDIVVYREPINPRELPPEPFPGGGHPLMSRDDCCAVIDTKTNFSDVKQYAAKPAFNLMNDCEENHLEFLGSNIMKCIFTCMTSSSPELVERLGKEFGLKVFVLGRYIASPVADAEARRLIWRLSSAHESPLSRFRRELQDSADAWLSNRETRGKVGR